MNKDEKFMRTWIEADKKNDKIVKDFNDWVEGGMKVEETDATIDKCRFR